RHIFFLDRVAVKVVIDAALGQFAAGLLELGPDIALHLPRTHAAIRERAHDGLVALRRLLLATLLFLELPPEFFLFLGDLCLAGGVLPRVLGLLLVEEVALLDVGALLSLARAGRQQDRQRSCKQYVLHYCSFRRLFESGPHAGSRMSPDCAVILC